MGVGGVAWNWRSNRVARWAFGNAAWLVTVKILLSLAAALVAGYTAVLEHLPFPTVLVLSVVAIAATVWLVNGAIWLHERGHAAGAGSARGQSRGAAKESSAGIARVEFSREREWIVNHNLGHRVEPMVLDHTGAKVETDIQHLSENSVRIAFAFPHSGEVTVRDGAIEAHLKGPEPHYPTKEYAPGSPIHNVWGQGIYRTLACGLENIGSGYDRGVRCDVVSPSGRTASATWNGLDDPPNRRKVAEEGVSVKASEAGEYVITWRSEVPAQYEPELIAHEVVALPPTGPLEGWNASHAQLDLDEIHFQVERDAATRGLLRGFCVS